MPERLKNLLYLEKTVGSFPLKCLLEMFQNNSHEVIKYLKTNYKITLNEDSTKEYDYIKERNIQVIPFYHEKYPKRLKNLLDSPLILFALGNIDLLDTPMISIVGTREPSQNTIEFTKDFTKSLNYTVVSGMAMGVDTIAHENSLPRTIGILGYGFNKLPSTILALLMEKEALLLSRFIYTPSIERWLFPHRNTLIAGLCNITCIMQCNIHSGTMDMAKKAMYYNNKIFAVPAHPLDISFGGNNKLINDGANILWSSQQIDQHYQLFQLNDIHNNPPIKPMTPDFHCDDLIPIILLENRSLDNLMQTYDVNQLKHTIVYYVLTKQIIINENNIIKAIVD